MPLRTIIIFSILVLLSILVLSGCEEGPKGASGGPGTPAIAPTLSVIPATNAQCPNVGGLQFLTSGISQGFVCNGSTGAPGQSIQGPAGTPAAPVVVSPASLLECLNGGIDISIGTSISTVCNGLNGSTGGQGPIGTPGLPGATGPQGLPGTNSTSISVVQFCPNVVPIYPTTFPEFALCIGNSLFGVYSTNGGFLAELPPGAYLSNAVGSTCNFNIGSNCSITY